MEDPNPTISNPYPDNPNPVITNFEYLSPLILFRGHDALKVTGRSDPNYVVARPYTVSFHLDGDPSTVTVPQGLLTDLASAPRIARPIVGRVGRHLEASIVHDYLYVAWQDLPDGKPRRQDRDFADSLMRAAMKKANVGRIRRALIYAAVRVAGWGIFKKPNPPPRYAKVPGIDSAETEPHHGGTGNLDEPETS